MLDNKSFFYQIKNSKYTIHYLNDGQPDGQRTFLRRKIYICSINVKKHRRVFRYTRRILLQCPNLTYSTFASLPSSLLLLLLSIIPIKTWPRNQFKVKHCSITEQSGSQIEKHDRTN